MIKIFQILGFLDAYKELNLSLAQKKGEIRSKLSAIALYQLLEDHDKQIIFIIPESNISTINIEKDQIISHLKDINRHKDLWKKQILQKILNNDQTIQFDIKIVQSIGNYKVKDENQYLIFDNHLNNLICDLFSTLLKIEQNEIRIIVDISTGLNIYTYAMIEALRSYLVYNKLQNIIKKETNVIAEIATIPPAIPYITDSSWIYPISLELYNVKAFFEFPVKEYRFDAFQKVISLEGLSVEKKKEIGPIMPKLDRNAESIIELTKIAFNTIKFNTPLVFFTPKIIDFSKKEKLINEQQSILSDLLDFIHQERLVENNNGNIFVKSLRIQKDKIINYYFILALLKSIIHFHKDSIKGICPIPERIEEIFTKLYSNLGLGTNVRFLERDLNHILSRKDQLRHHEAIFLSELFQNEGQTGPENQKVEDNQEENITLISDNKRNFFAHSGLSQEFTNIVKMDNDSLYLFYEETQCATLRSWLLNPEK